MKRCLLSLLLAFSVSWAVAKAVPRSSEAHKRNGLAFTENRGQILDSEGKLRPDVRFTADVNGAKLFFRSNAVSYVFPVVETKPGTETPAITGLYRMDMELVGANPAARIVGKDAAAGLSNFQMGYLPSPVNNVPSYGKITYENVYPNIDLVFYSAPNGGMKYDFVVRPGGRVADIKLKHSAASKVQLTRDGGFEAVTPLGTVSEAKPYTFVAGSNQAVASRYNLNGGTITFGVDAYDASQTLVIDPYTLVTGTYYGAASLDQAYDVAFGPNGTATVVGFTQSQTFPVTTGQTTFGGGVQDAFVIQFNNQGQRNWATFIGGSSLDEATGVAVDGSGNIYVSGSTSSNPVFAQNPIAAFGGDSDGFVAKFSSTGTYQWGTYIGGQKTDEAKAIAVDAAGNVYVAGLTYSENFPKTTAPSFNGQRDGFVVRYNTNGGVQWSALYGGEGIDELYAVAVSTQGVFVAGRSNSTTGMSSNSTPKGDDDFIVARFDSGNGSRVWGAYAGGSDKDVAYGIALDANNNVSAVGGTRSAGIAGAAGSFAGGSEDAFMAKFDQNGTALGAGYYGGSGLDRALAAVANASGDVFVTGLTGSTNLPMVDALQAAKGASNDAFIAKFSANGTLARSSYYGGSGQDIGRGVDFAAPNILAVVGQTSSPNFPVSGGQFAPFQGQRSSSDDAFVLWLTDPAGGNPCNNAITINVDSQVNPTVVNGTDGRITISVARATQVNTTYSILWSPNANTPAGSLTAQNLRAGTYTVTVTDQNQTPCTSTRTITLTDPTTNPCLTNPVIASAQATGASCAGSDGTVTVTVSGGNGVYSYQWQDNFQGCGTGASCVRTGLAAGSYRVTITDGAGCSTVSAADVSQQTGCGGTSISTATGSLSDLVFCEDGSVTLTVTSPAGGPGVTYDWRFNNGQSTVSVGSARTYTISSGTPAQSGTYSCVVTVNGVPSTSNGLQVVIYPNPLTTITANPGALCDGAPAQLCAPESPNPSEPYAYEWYRTNPIQQLPINTRCIDISSAGTYFVIVINTVTGCRDVSLPFELRAQTGPAKPSVTASGPTTFCTGQSVTLSLSSQVQSGVTYTWRKNGEFFATGTFITVTESGIYRLLATGNNGCSTQSDPIQVIVNTPPSASISASGATTFCSAASVNVQLTANAGVGFTYRWFLNGSALNLFTGSITATVAGDYTVEVRNALGCTALSAPVSVIVQPFADASITPSGKTNFCEGETVNVTLCGTQSPNIQTYEWLNAQDVVVFGPSSNPCFTVTTVGQYRLRISGGVCVAVSNPINVTLSPVPVSNAVVGGTGITTICEGGFVTLIANGAVADGFTYQWFINDTPILGANGKEYQAGTVGANRYSVLVTQNGCVAPARSGDITVTVYPRPIAAIRTATGAPIICTGSTLRLDATDLTSPEPFNLVYEWRFQSNVIPGATNSVYDAAVPGTYTVTVRNRITGCQASAEIELTQVNPPQASIEILGDPNFCFGQSVTLRANPEGEAYEWYLNNVNNPVGNTREIQARETGNYFVVVTQNTCRDQSPSVTVVARPLPGTEIVLDGESVICSGQGTVLRTDEGADAYQWLRSTTADGIYVEVPGATSVSFTVTQTGYYKVRATLDGCDATSATPFFVDVLNSPGAYILPEGPIVRCDGDETVILTAMPPAARLDYQWFFGETPEVAQPITGANDATYNPTITGRYWVLITSLVNQCSTLSSPIDVIFNPIPKVEISFTGDSIICEDGSVRMMAMASGANPGQDYIYQWLRNGEPIAGANAPTFAARENGVFTAIVIAEGCPSLASNPINVKVYANPDVTVTFTGTNGPCVGATLVSVVNDSLKIQWFRDGLAIPGATSATYFTVVPGNYQVNLKNDVSGCEETSTAITIFENPMADAGDDMTVCAATDFMLMGSATGGTGEYLYNWMAPAGMEATILNPTAQMPTVNIAMAGTYVYTLVVTDTRGCQSIMDEVTVTVLANPIADAGTDRTVCINSFQVLDASVIPGDNQGPFTFSWTGPNGFTSDQLNPFYTFNEAGVFEFTFTVVDGAGCSSTDVLTIEVRVDPTIIAVDGNPAISDPFSPKSFCFGGYVVLETPALPNARYNWYRDGMFVQGGIDNRYTAFIGGNFTVEVIDLNNGSTCTSQVPFQVFVVQTPVANIFAPTNILCPNSPITLSTSSFTGYSYTWLIGDTPATAVPAPGSTNNPQYVVNAPGRYWVLISSAEGCSSLSEPVDIISGTLTVDLDITEPQGCGNNDGMIVVNAASAAGLDLLYSLNGAPFDVNNVFTGLLAGEYNIRVTEVGGCSFEQTINLTVTAPKNLMVMPNTITDNSAIVSWDFVGGGGIIAYNLRYRVVGDDTWTTIGNIPNNADNQGRINWELFGLQNLTLYEVEVQTVCISAGIVSPWARTTFRTRITPDLTCNIPGGIYTNVVEGQTVVFWDNVPGVACYGLEYRTTSPLGAWTILNVTDANNPFALPGLLENTEYELRMRSFCGLCNGANASPYSPNIPFITPGDCNSRMFTINQNVLTIDDCYEANLMFDGIVEANYQFQWYLDGQPLFGATSPMYLATVTGNYSLEVRVGICDPMMTNTVSVAIRGDRNSYVIANVRKNVTCAGGADGIIEAGCSGPCNSVLGYRFSINGGPFQETGIFPGLAPGTYSVTMVDLATGCVTEARFPSNTTIGEPSPVQFVGGTANGTSSITVTYNTIPGAASYVISYRPVGSGETNWSTDIEDGTCISLFSSVCNYTFNELQNNTSYEFRIRTRCSAGGLLSDWNDTIIVKTVSLLGCSGNPADAVPGGVYSIANNQNSVSVFWNAVPGAACYGVRYRQQGATNTAWINTTTSETMVMINNLLPGTTYEYEVRSVCGSCDAGTFSDWSTTRAFRTPLPKTGEAAVAASSFTVYPNPNNGIFTVSFTATTAETVALKMLDITGKAVFTSTHEVVAGQNSLPVELNGFASGVYVLILQQGGQTHTAKVRIN